MSKVRILLVEDDVALAELTHDYLNQNGFTVDCAASASEALFAVTKTNYQLYICDLMLPDLHGLDLAKQLLKQHSAPLIFLTAQNDDETHIAGLHSGAIDFISKPVRPAVLLARIQTCLTRPLVTTNNTRLSFGPYVLDISSQRLERAGHVMILTDQEFSLLHLFVQQIGSPVSREVLFQSVIGRPYDGCDRAADLLISRLRKKLLALGCFDLNLDTRRSQGYVLSWITHG